MSQLPEAAESAQALLLNPFEAYPHWASRIAGLGGAEPSPDPAYVFATADSRPAVGQVRAVVRFHDLVMTRGTLLFEVRVRSAVPGAEQARLHTIPVDAAELVAAGGVAEVAFESYRNAYYAIACDINDETDIAASGISIEFDRQAAPDEHGRPWEWPGGKARRRSGIEAALVGRVLTELAMPRLEAPQSQVGSPQQCREAAFVKAMQALHRAPAGSFENWSLAYVLRVITRFSDEARPRRMLGYGEDQASLLSYFASRHCEVVGMRHVAEHEPRPDPGHELQRLRVPELCNEADFFGHAHLATGDVRQPVATFHNQFDVMWSISVNRLMTPQEYVYFVVNGLIHCKPGGLAVHVFDYVDDDEEESGTSLTRHDIERMAVLALSHYNDVARLQFVHDIAAPARNARLPFGLVLLRGGWQDD